MFLFIYNHVFVIYYFLFHFFYCIICLRYKHKVLHCIMANSIVPQVFHCYHWIINSNLMHNKKIIEISLIFHGTAVSLSFPECVRTMLVMELWKSSYWQQGTCYIHSWQFLSCFDSCRDYDFIIDICSNNMNQTWHSPSLFVAPVTGLLCGSAWMDLKSVPFEYTSTQQEHGI